jgi:histidinol phosphatase-like enzyme
VPPITCYCRKPAPGMGAYFIEKYKLNPAKCIMVGDMGSDKTFAARCGFQYADASEFFK